MSVQFKNSAATIASQTGSSGWAQYIAYNYVSSVITTQTFPLSFGFWLKMEGDLRTDYRFNFGEFNDGGSAYFAVVYSKINGGLGLGFSSGASNYYRQLNFNSWHHICLTYTSSTNRSLYLNGVRVVNQTSPTFNLINIASFNFGGTGSNSSLGCTGFQIACVNFFNRALTDTEVFSLANGETTGIRPTVVHDLSSTGFTARGGWAGVSPGNRFSVLAPWSNFSQTTPTIPNAVTNNNIPIRMMPNKTLSGVGAISRRRLFVVS